MFTPAQRELLRARLVSAAQADPNIIGAAHLGSAAINHQDSWSDIDLALSVSPDADMNAVISEWTDRFYEKNDAVAHYDLRRGDTLYRVFLLRNTLQVDISFWPAAQFGPVGPKFKLIFGDANQLKPSAVRGPTEMIGLGWLYALHVRSSAARKRFLQAEYMLAGMRNEVLALACRRYDVSSAEGRGFDDLPDTVRREFAGCYAASLDATELSRAFRITMDALLTEARLADADLANRIEATLIDIAQARTFCGE
jgi:hypothetical protein